MKRILILSIVIVGGLLFFAPQDAYADCILTGAQWARTTARTGESVNMVVVGEGCAGLRVTARIFSSAAGQVNTRTFNFGTNATAEGAYIFNPGDVPEGTTRTFFFRASVPGLAEVESNAISVTGGNCQLSAPTWPTGGARIGERMTMSVGGTGCAGYDISFEVWDDDPGTDDLIENPHANFPSTGNRLNHDISITTAEFQAAGGYGPQDLNGERQLEVYFIAKAGNSEVRSGTVTLTADVLPDDETPPTQTASGSRSLDYNFSIDNPLGGASDLMELIKKVSQWIFNLAIPVAVIFIIYGGLQFLFAGANPDLANKGKTTLKYAVIGLAIVLIGHGFVTLIQSIIGLGDNTPTPTPVTTPR